MHCTGCGKLLDEGATRCSTCGATALPPPPPGTEPVAFRYDAAPSRWPTVLKVVGVAAALAVIAVALSPMLTRVTGEVPDDGGGDTAAATSAVPLDTLPPISIDTAATVAPAAPDSTAPALVGDPGTNLPGITVTASCTARGSTDSQGNPLDFKPENTIDANPATAWRCGGDGSGVTLDYVLTGASNLSVVGANPGYDARDPHNGDDRFTQNRRLSSVRWTCLAGDATVATVEQTFQDVRQLQTTAATGFVGCTAIRMEITGSTAPGSRDFVAISEVRLGPG